MKNCKDIENRLPLYTEGLLSADEKKTVEEHLKSCSKCAKVLFQLQKTGRMVDGLEEVEPPPWFQQKIMARVREEAERKSFVQKWFYPLRIKIPIQVFATIFIVVIAVYIYRAGDEQLKAVMPPLAQAPVMETEKNKLLEQKTELSDAHKTVAKKKVAAKKDARDEKIFMYDVSPGAVASKKQELKKAMPQENARAETTDKTKTMKDDAAADRKEANYAALSGKQVEPAKPIPPPNVELERKKEGYVLGASMKQSRAPEAQSLMPKTTISVRVENINTAVGEVEKLLNKYEAKKVVRQMSEGKVIFTAEIKAKNIKDLIGQLKTMGKVEEKGTSADSVENGILVAIEIMKN